MKVKGCRAHHGRARALTALFATTAAIAGGTQALVPASAAALTNEGNECANLEWTWQVVDCELNHGGGGPGGSGGGGGDPDATATSIDEGPDLSDEELGIYPGIYGNGQLPGVGADGAMSDPDSNDPAKSQTRERLRTCRIDLARENRARRREFRLTHRRRALTDDEAQALKDATQDLGSIRADWSSNDCESVFGVSGD